MRGSIDIMRVFVCSGTDGRSDAGHFEILVYAKGTRTAIRRARAHLIGKGRTDLAHREVRCNVAIIQEENILHSTVERRP